MIASADEHEGKAGIVIDNGCLFRSGKAKAIRTGIINDNLIEAIILLPEKLFYNTGAPGAIIILNKNKPKARKEKILFINASREYEQHPEVRKLNRLGEANINNIAEAYREFKEKEGFSKIVDLETVQEYDYNLNVTRYVYPEDEVEVRVLIQSMKRNIERFHKDFMFQLNEEEYKILKSQIVILSWGGARRALPYSWQFNMTRN